MPVTAGQMQTLIALEVGDVDPTTGDPTTAGTGLVAANIVVLWDRYSDKALVAPRLQELYVKRDALELVLAKIAFRVDSRTADVQDSESQWAADRRKQLIAVQEEIGRVEMRALGTRAPAVGALTTTAPVTPPLPITVGPRDANDPRYTGSPYTPGWEDRR